MSKVLIGKAAAALDRFGAQTLEKEAAGILVFPEVIKAGFGFGGQYGQGVLFDGDNRSFYDMVTVSFGWQLGFQKRTVILFFMTKEALINFKMSQGWKVGVDASVALITADVGAEFDSSEFTDPVIAVVTDRQGLMYNLSLEGTKISPISKK